MILENHHKLTYFSIIFFVNIKEIKMVFMFSFTVDHFDGSSISDSKFETITITVFLKEIISKHSNSTIPLFVRNWEN